MKTSHHLLIRKLFLQKEISINESRWKLGIVVVTIHILCKSSLDILLKFSFYVPHLERHVASIICVGQCVALESKIENRCFKVMCHLSRVSYIKISYTSSCICTVQHSKAVLMRFYFLLGCYVMYLCSIGSKPRFRPCMRKYGEAFPHYFFLMHILSLP